MYAVSTGNISLSDLLKFYSGRENLAWLVASSVFFMISMETFHKIESPNEQVPRDFKQMLNGIRLRPLYHRLQIDFIFSPSFEMVFVMFFENVIDYGDG